MNVDICRDQSRSETLGISNGTARKERMKKKNQRRFFQFLRRRVFGDIGSSAKLPIGCQLADSTITTPAIKRELA